MCQLPHTPQNARSTHNPRHPLVLNLSNPAEVRIASEIGSSGSNRPLYWVSPCPPEEITGTLSTGEFQGAWITADGTHAVCHICPGTPVAQVRVPTEVGPSEIPAFLTRLILVRLGWDVPRSPHVEYVTPRKPHAAPRITAPHQRRQHAVRGPSAR